ncbi:MAG: hypothetical protein HY917_01410 [Candidatus Diapherotrites archaeon]|nr:hypothetical protein [Candidatus Diapherotrites archaeon]
MLADLIGFAGGFFIMVSFVPQVIRSYQTQSVNDLSTGMILATLIGTAFWIAYGFLIASAPIIIMNGIFATVVLFQLHLKIRFTQKP